MWKRGFSCKTCCVFTLSLENDGGLTKSNTHSKDTLVRGGALCGHLHLGAVLVVDVHAHELRGHAHAGRHEQCEDQFGNELLGSESLEFLRLFDWSLEGLMAHPTKGVSFRNSVKLRKV